MRNGGAPHVLLLVAGAGDRIDATLSAALQPVFFKPLIRWALDAVDALPRRSLGIVVGQGERELRESLREYEDARYFPLRAGVGSAEAVLAAAGQLGEPRGSVLVLSASAPLLRTSSIEALWSQHIKSGAACTVSDAGGEEHAGLFAFELAALRALPPGIGGREGMLADVVAALAERRLKVTAHRLADPDEALDVADAHLSWRAETILRARFNRDLMLAGVLLRDPRTTVIDPRCRIGRGVVIEGGVTVLNSSIDGEVTIESASRIIDSTIGARCHIKQGSRIEKSRLGKSCVIGPYAHLRPGSSLSDEAYVGNFVEIKNSSIGSRTKVSHLSYVGDAQIGRNVNVGCGFITCNYDGGPVKLRTIIEDDVFIGSDSQAIAPVRFGAGSFIATGSSVTEDVPAGAFVISRGRQVTKPGYAKKYGHRKVT